MTLPRRFDKFRSINAIPNREPEVTAALLPPAFPPPTDLSIRLQLLSLSHSGHLLAISYTLILTS